GKSDEWKVPFLQRAKFWLEQARNGLSGADKLDVVTRISKINDQLAPLLAAATPKDPGSGNPNPKNPTPKKSSEPVLRKNFNTLKNEATLKTQWKIDGTSRTEIAGLRLMANPVSATTTFQLVDNWRVEILLGNYDGRDIEFEV